MSFYSKICDVAFMLELDHDVVTSYDKKYHRCVKEIKSITRKMRRLRTKVSEYEVNCEVERSTENIRLKHLIIENLISLKARQEIIIIRMCKIIDKRREATHKSITVWISSSERATTLIDNI